MSDRAMLSPAERQSIKAELELIQKERNWSQGQLGKWLDGLTQQSMSKALDGKAGPVVARLLYEKLKTTRADLIAKHRNMIPEEFIESAEADDGIEGSGITGNRKAAMADFDWADVEPSEYEQVHNLIAAEYFATGIDPEPAYWLSRISRLLREVRGTAKGVPERVPVDVPSEDGPSPERLEQLARRPIKATPTKR